MVPGVAVMLVPVLFPLQPAGSVHMYDVAPLTAGMEYVCCITAQTAEIPEMATGCAGMAADVTASVALVDAPQ